MKTKILQNLGIPTDASTEKVRTGKYYDGTVINETYEINNSDIAGAVVKAAGLMTMSEATEELFVPVYDANDTSKYNYGTYNAETGVFTFYSGATVTKNTRTYTDKNDQTQTIACGLPIYLTNPVSYHMEDGSNTYKEAGKATAVFYVPKSVFDNCK